jgi:regulator of sirC expression with transglutaminase-like and TPR domain
LDITDKIDKEFSRIASLPNDQIDLAHGALLIAKSAFPDLDESVYLDYLHRIAARIKPDFASDEDPAGFIAKINRVLFDVEKFHGNRENYYDPDNSFLNRVIDRKTGIPITLSLIYIEIARRLGLDVRGVGLPGHFITALYHDSGEIFIDPFNGGEIRTRDDCLEIVRTYTSGTEVADFHWLKPVTNSEILARMLRNLKPIYARQGDDVMLFKMIHWILALQPGAPAELAERALLYEAMGNPARAADDWEQYIVSIDNHETANEIRARIDHLKNQKSRLH